MRNFGSVQFLQSLGWLAKLCGNCEFRQNLHTKKLGKITVFYAVLALAWLYIENNIQMLSLQLHCVKSVSTRSFSAPYFPAFGLNADRYSVSLGIESEWGKMWTRKTPNTNTFHAVNFRPMFPYHSHWTIKI